jgi:hemerythrin-like domain-containing protein
MEQIPKFYNRRVFIRRSAIAGSGLLLASSAFVTSCKSKDEKISPSEDLMREHGMLNRILLIYDFCRNQLLTGQEFPLNAITESAAIIRKFIEDYHEKLEEDFIFPKFGDSHPLSGLVKTLRQQHDAGRNVTGQILNYSKSKTITADENIKLISLINDFNRMYRPHEAREDTVLFPALKKMVSKHEYDSMGEDFEKKEHDLFGEDGFEVMVDKVAAIEKQLGIFELSQFTPKPG